MPPLSFPHPKFPSCSVCPGNLIQRPALIISWAATQHMVAEMNVSGQFSLTPACTTAQAVEGFLAAIRRASFRSFPAWMGILKEGIEDCPLDYDTHRAVFDMHPLDDFYFAGATGLEATRIRSLFEPNQANELLSAIAERVDSVSGRSDRLVSDMIFTIVSRIDVTATDSQQQPHDQVVAIILHRMGIPAAAATRHLMSDLHFRHQLGQPLALDIPKWWPAFSAKFTLTDPPPESPPAEPQVSFMSIPESKPPAPTRRRSIARRFI
ncbi:MAG: hypothetical protein EPO08_00155 [Rhodospirillaceae bacterium]|nr:MAG: hypothetical protein EPO08_00155 [Rhodospirillaceae bacterium]